MLDRLSHEIKCEICGGELELSSEATINDYTIITGTNSNNIFNNLEELIGKYLVYKCTSCKFEYKYTYKELEKALRKNLTQKMLLSIAKGNNINMGVILDKFYIYCGKCNGFDGKGSCLRSIFNKCDIKRFPPYEL